MNVLELDDGGHAPPSPPQRVKRVHFPFTSLQPWKGAHTFDVWAWILPDQSFAIERVELIDRDGERSDVTDRTYYGLAVPGLHATLRHATLSFTLDKLRPHTVSLRPLI